jgi:signal transduction histidine kinase
MRFPRERVLPDRWDAALFGRSRDATRDRTSAGRERPRRGLTWPLRSLLAASLTVPVLLLAFAAWQNFRLVQIQAEHGVMIETSQLHEHAVSVLETYALVLAWVDNRTRGLDWDQIEHDDGLRHFLADIESLPQIATVSIVDNAGRARVSGHAFPATVEDASAREAFLAQKERNVGIFVGPAGPDQPTHTADFDISRRRSTSDGSFAGVIIVSARRDYFSDFFRKISREENFAAVLMRSDGLVLVRYPLLPSSPSFQPDSRLQQAISQQPDRGLFQSRGSDGMGRLFAYQRVGAYPLYIVLGVPIKGVLASWWANLVNYLLFAVPASLGLFCMTLFAAQQLQRQKVATWRWRTTALRAKREMNRRALAEAELHQAQKMEALGQLTGGVAHDFNNLLTVLQGSLEMLSGRQQDPKLQARLEMAFGTIERAEKLTSQLLAFARRQPLTVARVDLNDLLRQMAELLTRTVGSGIAVETDLWPELWPIDVDATQLELAVINLAINSRDAMPTGGVLRVRTFNKTSTEPVSSDGLASGGDFVGLEISDTGTGMPPEVIARAFEPLFTTKGPDKGTGLGLSMVYGFARQSGGSATIRSELGRGTAVTLLLPRSKVGASVEERATDLPAAYSA